MQNKISKQILSFLIVLCFILCTININSICSHARTKNVTNSISTQNKKSIKKLTKCFSTPCGYDLTERMIQGEETGYMFTNANARRHILNLSYDEIYKTNKTVISKRLFWRDTSNIEPTIGQWGLSYPLIKVKHIYKLSANKYKVKTNLVWCDTEYDTYTKVREVDFSLKKKANSYYGYIDNKNI